MEVSSCAHFYRFLIIWAATLLSPGHSSAICLLHSVNFAEIEALQRAGDWNEAGNRLADAALGLERAGADMLVLCTNTMHKVADRIQFATPKLVSRLPANTVPRSIRFLTFWCSRFSTSPMPQPLR